MGLQRRKLLRRRGGLRDALSLGAFSVAAVLAFSCATGADINVAHSATVTLRASTLHVGDTTSATAVVLSSSGTPVHGVSVTWKSTDPTVAIVSPTGLVSAVSVGTANIVGSAGDLSANATVSVVPAPAGTVARVDVTLAASSLVAGTNTQAAATLRDSSGTVVSGSVTWSSGNSTVAQVSSSGVVTAVAAGNTNIIASSNGISGSAVLTVSAPAASPSPAKLGMLVQPSSTVGSGLPLPTQPAVQVLDSAGNAVKKSGISVTAKVASGGAVLSGTTAVTTDTNGTARFTNLVLTGSGSQTLQFSATGLTAVVSATISVTTSATTGAPAKLGMLVQPSSTVGSGLPLPTQPAVQVLDSAGNAVKKSGIAVTASVASGGAVLSGTTSVATDTNGTARFTNLVLTGSGPQTLQFSAANLTPVVSATITLASSTTPDILNNADFETAWDGFTDWSNNPPPTGVTRATDYAYTGSYSVRRTWVPNPGSDVGSQMVYTMTPVDRVWVRFYFRLTAPITSIMKFVRFYDPTFTTPYGGFFLQSGNGIVSVGWDAEDYSIVTPIGLSQAQVIDGNWHSLEIEYWRNGDPSGYPSMAFWFDGNPLSMPDGTSSVTYACPSGASCNKSYWKGGRLYAGERAGSQKLGVIEWLATLNAGNTTSGQVNLDRVSISTLGPIGP